MPRASCVGMPILVFIFRGSASVGEVRLVIRAAGFEVCIVVDPRWCSVVNPAVV